MSEVIAALIGALVAGIFTSLGKTKDIKHESIIRQREEWRSYLRKAIPAFVVNQPIDKEHDYNNGQSRLFIRHQVALRLSPYDENDQELLALMDKLTAVDLDKESECSSEIVKRFSELLKFDWERAKIETSWFPFFASERAHEIIRGKKEDCVIMKFSRKILFSILLAIIVLLFYLTRFSPVCVGITPVILFWLRFALIALCVGVTSFLLISFAESYIKIKYEQNSDKVNNSNTKGVQNNDKEK